MDKKKIAFLGIWSDVRYPFLGEMPRINGMVRTSGTRLADALELSHEVDNRGNMIHGEAPARIFEFDRARSCFVSSRALIVEDKWSPEQIAEELSKRFDLVVFSAANTIRPNFAPGAFADILRALRCDFVALGMGMQNEMPDSIEDIHPNLLDLLNVCNEKALLFGVRGLETERWLKAVGFDRAVALGCPSLFVYPKNILRMRAPEPQRVRRAVTAGYIHGRVERSLALIKLFQGFEETHYVMQEELVVLRHLGLLTDEQEIYNDATGEVAQKVIEPVLEQIQRRQLPFASYRWFQDTSAWRAFVSQFDFFLGDRLHGGVVALQAGVPSIMMVDDLRVSEIADFFAIPKLSLQAAKDVPLREIVATLLSESSLRNMQETYAERLSAFEAAFLKLNIPLAVGTGALAPKPAVSAAPRQLPPPSVARRLKDWLSDAIR